MHELSLSSAIVNTVVKHAQERAVGMVRQNAWLLYDGGKAAISPDEVGIARPEG